jgi:Zn finger protein HypA/HybF involved in hydrogenase expression
MPSYDFKCQDVDCFVYFEKQVPYGTEQADCPKCHGKGKRVMIAPGERSNIRFFFNYLEP